MTIVLGNAAASAGSDVERVGEAVREARHLQGLSQAQVAQQAQVSRSFVVELESGHARAELGKVLQVLSALNLATLIEPAHAANESHRERLEFARAGLALAGHEIADPVLQDLEHRVAHEQITAEQAIAAARAHVQG